MTAVRGILRVLAVPPLAVLALFSAAALWFDGPASRPLAAGLAGAFALACAWVAIRLRPFWVASVGVLALCAAVLLWWLQIPPSNDRNWQPDVARLPHVIVDGDQVTIENVRNFDYSSETDFEEHWETRHFDLSKLRATDMYLIYWGSPHIAHTIVSWVFEEGPPLAISIETRKEVGESYSAVRGFFRQYELYYVVADERDVIGVRALYRGEDVYLYRLRMPLERSRDVLLDYLRTIDDLREKPRWYNALVHNCTTTIRQHVQAVAPSNPWSWKILANGHLDEMGYERGTIDTSLPFTELRARSAVSARARAIGTGPDFSRRLREGLPGMDGSPPAGSP